MNSLKDFSLSCLGALLRKRKIDLLQLIKSKAINNGWREGLYTNMIDINTAIHVKSHTVGTLYTALLGKARNQRY